MLYDKVLVLNFNANCSYKFLDFFFFLCIKILDYILHLIASMCVLFHAIYVNKLFPHFVFYRWKTSFLLCSDARAELIHQVEVKISLLCISFEYLYRKIICALTEAAKRSWVDVFTLFVRYSTAPVFQRSEHKGAWTRHILA